MDRCLLEVVDRHLLRGGGQLASVLVSLHLFIRKIRSNVLACLIYKHTNSKQW